MNQELRDKVMNFRKKALFSGAELIEIDDLQRRMRFDAPEDVDFDLMDFFFDDMLSRILHHAEICAYVYGNWGRAYEEFKPYISHYVGWQSCVSSEEHPMLCDNRAYSLMMGKLRDACWTGEGKHWKGGVINELPHGTYEGSRARNV